MRLMATVTPLKAHWSVFKSKWPAFVAVASHASPIVSGKRLRHCLGVTAVRIVAIHARHRAFGQLVMRRLLKRRPNIGMAGGTLLVDRSRCSRNHSLGTVRVHRVASHAGNLVARVAGFQPAHMSRLIQVASHANFVGCHCSDLRRIANIIRRKRLGVFLRRAMAGFAGLVHPTSFFVRIHNMMRTLLESVVDVFVAGLADLRSYVRCRLHPVPPLLARTARHLGIMHGAFRCGDSLACKAPHSILCMHLIDCFELRPFRGTPCNSLQIIGIAESVRGGGDVHMAASARGGDRLDRIERPLWVHHGIQARGQIQLAAVHVAMSAIACVASRTSRTHSRIAYVAKVVVAPAKPDHDVGTIRREVVSRVDAVHQQIEVDALGGQRFVGRDGCTRSPRTSVLDGLWHSTQYSVWFRRPPCNDKAAWQLLQLLVATTARRGEPFEPSTAKLMT